MALKRGTLVHTALMGSGIDAEKARLLQLGRMRGGPTPGGGFFVEIVGNGVSRRAEMTPFETVTVAKAMLEVMGVRVEGLDPNSFRHTNG